MVGTRIREDEPMNWMLTILLGTGQEIVREYATELHALRAESVFREHFDVVETELVRKTATQYVRKER